VASGVHFSQALCRYLPDAAFWSFKLALLLSLVPGDDEDRPISVLVVGDSPLVNRCLAAAARFAKTSVVYSSAADLLPTFRSDSALPHGCYLDPGVLLLAEDKGLVRIPFLSHLKPAQMLSLAGAMDTQTAAAKIPARLREHVHVPHVTSRMQSTIWATAAASAGAGAGAKKPPAGTSLLQARSGVPEKLIEQFDLVFVLDDANSLDTDEDVSAYLLETLMSAPRATATAGAPPGDVPGDSVGGAAAALQHGQDSDDLHALLERAEHSQVSISDEASRLLQEFYLASRRIRASQRNAVEIDKRSLKIMTQLAKNHARLSTRDTVVVPDALLAILLYEETLAARYGTSVFSFNVMTSIYRRNIDNYHGNTTEEAMQMFHQHVLRFIGGHSFA